MHFLRDLGRSVTDEWYILSGGLRARMLFYVVAVLALINLAAFLEDLIRDRDLATFFYLLTFLASALLTLVRAVVLFGEPYLYKATTKKLRALSGEDLDLLEILLRFEGEIESDELHRAIRDQRERDGRPTPVYERVCGQWVWRDVLASLKRLRQAGLVRDLREHIYDDGIRVQAADEARDLLESERERRGRVARSGPRSRPGALAG